MEKKQEDFIEKQIDLHIAEYNTLTNRCTYFINIQNILITALIAWIILIGTVWSSKFECLLMWGLLIGSQIIAIINASIAYENYNIIRYIESELKPKISKLIRNENFWNYELYLIKQRRTIKYENKWLIIFDYLPVILLLFEMIIITILRFCHWHYWDCLGVILNSILFVAIISKTIQTSKLRINAWR